ncbi:MAG: hypothetical protein AAGA66_18265 [Bacteroidota bacterium]
MEKVKSFTFKVAKTADSNSKAKQLKVQNGVALAGCSMKELIPGSGMFDFACAQPAHGDGAWC